jgi:hypothetical protein
VLVLLPLTLFLKQKLALLNIVIKIVVNDMSKEFFNLCLLVLDNVVHDEKIIEAVASQPGSMTHSHSIE